MSLDGSLQLATDAMDTDVELVHASERELEAHGLSSADFPLYTPMPFLAVTEKLGSLGWESTPLSETVARTVDEHLESGRTGEDVGPDREKEEAALNALAD